MLKLQPCVTVQPNQSIWEGGHYSICVQLCAASAAASSRAATSWTDSSVPGISVPRSELPAGSTTHRTATAHTAHAPRKKLAGISSLPVTPVSQSLSAGAVPPNSEVDTL